MKRFYLSPITAIFTLLIGVTAAWTFILLAPLPNLEHLDIKKSECLISPQFLFPPEPEPYVPVDIKYAWTLMGKHARTGVFKVTNYTDKSIYYSGYEKYDHRRTWIKQKGKVKSSKVPEGVGIQELKSGESVVVWIPIPDNEKSFEIGFAFKFGNQDCFTERTIWVKVSKQIESYGLTCNNRIVTPNSVLADTCLEPLSH